MNQTKSIIHNSITLNTKEKLKDVRTKMRSHKITSTANGAKQNARRSELINHTNHILTPLSNNTAKHTALNGSYNGVEVATNKHTIDQISTKCIDSVNGHSEYDNGAVVQILRHDRKSIRSGLLNFCAVAMALNDQGYRAVGIRIDSGDLAYLSRLARETFDLVASNFNIPWFKTLTIVASNDINEDTIVSLNEQAHKIDCFGIGTHLVTCQRQPALGCVYKLVEINGHARIKLSKDVEKATMPGNKNVYRLYSPDGEALIDLMQKNTEPAPAIGQKVLCRHPYEELIRTYVIPSRVEPMYKIYWKDGVVCQELPTLEEVRENVQSSLRSLRDDHKRTLNATPYKVSVSDELYSFIHTLWLENSPIGELS